MVITKTQGAPLFQRKEGVEEGRVRRAVLQAQKLTLTLLYAAVKKESGNPGECGIAVFPIMSIPLGPLAAKTWTGSRVQLA